jgi:putative SOS response-associated peptidase YedK
VCGRYTSTTPRDKLGVLFEALVADSERHPSYNVSPTTDVYVVLDNGGVRKVDVLRWGLVPGWAKDLKIGGRMINARAESVATSNAYKGALRRRRAILPADGSTSGRSSRGVSASSRTSSSAAMVTRWLWLACGSSGGAPTAKAEPLRTCTIITTTAKETMAPIHDRMPVILPPAAWDTWLDPSYKDIEALRKLLVPAPAELLVARPVSTAVNSVCNDGPELIAEATGDQVVD